nr:glycoside hydrolase family 2 TIM barrel-domain containing protein [uncultured Pedobacter sp.]
MKRITIFAVLVTIFSFNTQAQHSQRLTKNWEFLKSDLGGIWEANREAKPGSSESVPLWTKVNLPHCFNATDAVDPDVNYYQGPGWYRTSLKIDNPYKNGRTILHFEGAGQKTQVYVFNTKVGEHVGGYDEWTVDITDAVASFKKDTLFKGRFKGQIPISIRCDNSRDLEMMPSDLADFNIYGGLYRYLNLVYQPQLSIDKVFALAEVDVKGKQGTLKISSRFYNPQNIQNANISIRVTDPKGKTISNSQKEFKGLRPEEALSLINIKKPALWSPETPNLYTVEITAEQNGEKAVHTEKVGFRNFEFVKKGPFMLNGRRLLLRGTHRHEDHAGVGAAMTEDMIRTEMKMMKDMGVNFIRLGHYQQSRIVLNLCDSLGIMVWEEIPWCRGGLGGPVYQAQGKRMLTNMIEQHYNHPAVIIWGLGNENDWPNDFTTFDKGKIRAYMTELNNLSHKLDRTRMTAIRRCDFCKDIVDVYSPSIWAGWYRGIYTDYKEIVKNEFNDVDHFLHIEWGGDSHAGRHSENPDDALSKVKKSDTGDERAGDASLFGGSARVSKDGDWSESYVCNLIDWHLKEQETMPWLTGSAYWPFKDFSTPVRPDNPVPYVNQKGVVERDFTKKEAYYVFQSYWIKDLMAHIYGHSWPVRWGDKGEARMVKVYSNADEAELFVNGKSQGIRKRNSQDFPAAGLRWMVNYQEGNNEIKVIAKKGKETVTDEITQAYQTAKWGKPAQLTLTKIKDAEGKITIEAKLLDANNVLCLDAKNYVYFGLTGDGKLIDDQGTSSGSRKVQLYNGRAVISLYTKNGKSVASVKADGISTQFLNL